MADEQGSEGGAVARLQDGVSTYRANAADLELYETDRRALLNFRAPVLLHSGNPHERLYVASFDGTGNDKFKDPEHATNVARVDNQVRVVGDQNKRISGGYYAGPGTQNDAVPRWVDGAVAYTHGARVQAMYQQFIWQAWTWRQLDPMADIRLVDIGFSRGAEEAASLARMVSERGIQDPSGAIYQRDAQGNITHVEYTKPALVEPGKVAQVVGLFDPVGTGEPEARYDRRLPPSVISGFQIIAKDEHRGLFKSDHIIDPGMTADGRFLGVYVPGAHSDVGGGYLLNGLSTRSGNLMIDYLNALSDQPYLSKSPEPSDPAMNVVHRSTEGMLLYRVWNKVERTEPEGYNTLEAARHPRHGEPVLGDPYNAAPRDEALSSQFAFQPVRIGAVPQQARENEPAPAQVAARQAPATSQGGTDASVDAMIERLYQAAVAGDSRGMDAVADDYLQSAQGTRWWQAIQPPGVPLGTAPSPLSPAPDKAAVTPAMALER